MHNPPAAEALCTSSSKKVALPVTVRLLTLAASFTVMSFVVTLPFLFSMSPPLVNFPELEIVSDDTPFSTALPAASTPQLPSPTFSPLRKVITPTAVSSSVLLSLPASADFSHGLFLITVSPLIFITPLTMPSILSCILLIVPVSSSSSSVTSYSGTVLSPPSFIIRVFMPVTVSIPKSSSFTWRSIPSRSVL